ncbi:MAG: hypothetical protein U0457_13405 [Candidatus Sericytochromatia bacterium]
MNTSKFLGLSLALLIGVGGISGCQQPMVNKPVATNSNVNSNVNSNSNNVSAPVYTIPNAPQTAQNFSAEVQDALLMDSEDEKYLEDSDTSLANSDKSFAVKSLLPNAPAGTERLPLATALATKVEAKAEAREAKSEAKDIKAEAKAEAKAVKADAKAARPRAEIKKAILGNGAVTRNENGTLTIDKAKLKENFKAVKEVAKQEVEKLKRKNNVVRTSDVKEQKNDDGSNTKTATVDFENKRTGVKRDIVNVRTVGADGKLDNATHELTATHKNFDRKVTRTVTANDDGSKKIVFDSVVTWKDGRKREVHRETTLDASGNGSAVGTITITAKDGKVTKRDFTSNITTTGGVKTMVQDPATKATVTVEEKTDGSAMVTTAVDGEASKTETVASVEAKVEASETAAPASDATSTTTTASASATTSTTTTASAS